MDEDLNRRNQEIFSASSKFWISLANQQLFELNRQLLALSVVLLPLTASILLVESITLKEFQKTLLGLSWIFLFISIICGATQIAVDAVYFKNLSRDSSKREEIWHQKEKTVHQKEAETEKLGRVPGASTFLPLFGQAFTITIALILVMSVAASFLFSK